MTGKKDHSLLTSFDAIANSNANILILGSMPGQKSLTENQYYAHPRNSFWPIIAQLFNIELQLCYTKRIILLKKQKIALWDVVHHCVRKGSLDSNIEKTTVIPNNFQSLFKKCPAIHSVFFNGQKAAALYKTQVLPKLGRYTSLFYHTLPSTSPAHASLDLQQKYQLWLVLKKNSACQRTLK